MQEPAEKRQSLTNGNSKRPDTPGTSRNESQLFAVSQVKKLGIEFESNWLVLELF